MLTGLDTLTTARHGTIGHSPAATPQAGPPPPSDAELITLAVAQVLLRSTLEVRARSPAVSPPPSGYLMPPAMAPHGDRHQPP